MTVDVLGHTGTIATTDDFSSWELFTAEDPTEQVTAGVITNSLGLFAFTNKGRIFRRDEGSTYWSVTGWPPFLGGVLSAATYEDTVVAVLDNGFIAILVPGATSWTQMQVAFDSTLRTVSCLRENESESSIVDGACWVFASEIGIKSAVAGTNVVPGWKSFRTSPNPFWGLPIFASCRGDQMWLIGGANGNLAYSIDGFEWLPVPAILEGHIYHIGYDEVLGWIAVGSSSLIAISVDGFTWDQYDCSESVSPCAADVVNNPSHSWYSAAAVSDDCWFVVGENNRTATVCICPGYYYTQEGCCDLSTCWTGGRIVWSPSGWYYDGDNSDFFEMIAPLEASNSVVDWSTGFRPNYVTVEFTIHDDWYADGSFYGYRFVLETTDGLYAIHTATPEYLKPAGRYVEIYDLTDSSKWVGGGQGDIVYIGLWMGYRSEPVMGSSERSFTIHNITFSPKQPLLCGSTTPPPA